MIQQAEIIRCIQSPKLQVCFHASITDLKYTLLALSLSILIFSFQWWLIRVLLHNSDNILSEHSSLIQRGSSSHVNLIWISPNTHQQIILRILENAFHLTFKTPQDSTSFTNNQFSSVDHLNVITPTLGGFYWVIPLQLNKKWTRSFLRFNQTRTYHPLVSQPQNSQKNLKVYIDQRNLIVLSNLIKIGEFVKSSLLFTKLAWDDYILQVQWICLISRLGDKYSYIHQ